MSVQPIGLMTLVIGFACLVLGPNFSSRALVCASLLGSAAALFLGSSGQVQPAHLLLAFVVPTVLSRRASLVAALENLVFPRAGFWLAFAVAYGVLSAVLMPRIFAGATQINAIGQSESGASIMLTPLAPVGGNLTQTVYLVADLACYLTIVGVCATREGMMAVGKALIAYAVLNAAFALVDLGTYYTNTAYLLDFMRNAQYTFHLDEVTGGLKRIAGSFTETASFSYATLGALGYTGTLFLHGRWPALTGALAAVSVLLLVLSTSSTAIVGGPFVLLVLYVTALRRVGRARGGSDSFALSCVFGLPLLAVVAVMAVVLHSGASATVAEYLNTLVFDKATSQSGLERASWNAAALQNWIDTFGLGAGLGSVRASSFAIAVPANLGIPGCVFFLAFFWQTLILRPAETGVEADFRVAARNGCLGLLLAAALSGALVDLGLEFYLLAGLATLGRRHAAFHRAVRAAPIQAVLA